MGSEIQIQPMEEEEEMLQPKIMMQPAEEEEEMLQSKPNISSINDTKFSNGVIQRDNIPYRDLAWSDFQADPPEEAHHDASVFSGIRSNLEAGRISYSWVPTNEDTATVTISYDSSQVSLSAYMTQEESWKNAWLTDDEAAQEKLGEGADIGAARAALLRHEQIHFRNAQTVANNYDATAKAAVPSTPYTENITFTSEEDANAQALEIFEQKSTELDDAVNAVAANARTELSRMQGIYDVDTNHSQNTERQTHWEENYDEAFQEARDRDEEE